ncbi:hypothetical protein [Aliidiomarina quisquiliarum]|uniref:hypothetical protein n=1 Tax=Aliidiomarina quisquiliarum TaxID=2938947 RepID=UPI00208DEADD|nr:hypothetical protein [Aliidiomarina quisquiliarum]MCO4320360.1 hypothetical protein [Aliidiomarina quisquiliarum]
MNTALTTEVVASIFLKYLTLQPVELLLDSNNTEHEIKLWICPDHGTPAMGAGIQDLPLDLPVACVYPSNFKYKRNDENITNVTHNDVLNQLLIALSRQMRAQLHSFDVSNNQKAKEALMKLIEQDKDIIEIANTFFPMHQKVMSH